MSCSDILIIKSVAEGAGQPAVRSQLLPVFLPLPSAPAITMRGRCCPSGGPTAPAAALAALTLLFLPIIGGCPGLQCCLA